MISYKVRNGKRARSLKLPKNLERLYKEGKCRDCSVVVTRMDFEKILGKFTKVKIQYESSSSPSTQKTSQTNKTQLETNRLRNNENGLVQLRRSAYNPHPARNLLSTRRSTNSKVASPSTLQTNTNILKEINVLKNAKAVKNRNTIYNNTQSNVKRYAIIFNIPTSTENNNIASDQCLFDLLPKVNTDILPSDEWCIDYFPKKNEPQNDKVYDRIAAELEDLMYNKKSDTKLVKSEPTESKADEFPSIMDILNDNTAPENNSESKDNSSNLELKNNIESNDVEAMLLGKTKPKIKTPMDVDSSDVNKLIADVVQFNSLPESVEKNEFENPHSPSILDEALKKGIEEHLPNPYVQMTRVENKVITQNLNLSESVTKNTTSNSVIPPLVKSENVTHLIFKQVLDGKCKKSVTCPRNLKYTIELEGKSVEFLGAPKHVSSTEDLQVLLQIVNETDLKSLYVLY